MEISTLSNRVGHELCNSQRTGTLVQKLLFLSAEKTGHLLGGIVNREICVKFEQHPPEKNKLWALMRTKLLL